MRSLSKHVPVMLSLSKYALGLLAALLPLAAHAQTTPLQVTATSPSIDSLDAGLRATGNRKATAVAIGRALFRSEWPAQVLKVYASGIDTHEVAGLTVSGVKFHERLSRPQFYDEIVALVADTFAAAPVEEVDVWATVPLSVGKGIVVTGDIAKPTSRTVFTLTVRRGEAKSALVARLRAGSGIFIDQEWAHAALK
ncbi:MAG TPA: hypothetical protein VIG51_09020 [Candidatus Baltobacteraceae bacterium]